MAERMTTRSLLHFRRTNRQLHRVLQVLRLDMMSSHLATAGIHRWLRRRKDKLPQPRALRVRILLRQGEWQINPTAPSRQILPVQLTYDSQMGAQGWYQINRKHSDPIFEAFSIAYNNPCVTKVDVLNA